MDSVEINKIVAAGLTAGVIAMFTGFIAHVLVKPHELDEPVYLAAASAATGGEEAPSEEPEMSMAMLLAAADAAAGEKGAKKCSSCHTFEKDGANKLGPNLWDLVDRPIASVAGFGYSEALQAMSGDAWSYQNLNDFLHAPKEFAPGTKMSFAGVKKAPARANLIAFLRGLSDDPTPMPEPEAATAEEPAETAEAPAEGGGETAEAPAEDGAATAEPAPAPAAADSLAGLLAAADVAAGEKGAKKCKACHTFDQDGANKVGPNLWNVVDRPIASVEGGKYSDALAGMSDQTWSYDNLDGFLTKPKDFAPGTKMSFAGVKKLQARADLIAYLRSLSDSPAPLPPAAAAPATETTTETAGEATPEAAPEEAAAEETPAEETAATSEPAEAEPETLAALLGDADLAAGEKTAKKCKACHTFDKDGADKLGPNLWDVVDQPIAAAEGFKYSGALEGLSDQTWTYDNLDAFLTKPKDFAPGTKMSFAGVKALQARADLIAYLRYLSDSPADLPE